MSSNLKQAVFLDRDGTIIEDRGYLHAPSDVVFYPDTVRALKKLQEHFMLFVVTHQPGVAAGCLSAEEVARVNEYIVAELHRRGVTISGVYCCPHRRDERCACIKPRPFFLEMAARAYGLDLRRSFVVGDHPHDVTLADNAGAIGVYVLTGHGIKHRRELQPQKIIVPGIREATEWILSYREMLKQEDDNPGMLEGAANILRNSGIVAFPTETVYGLGAAVFDEKAVARVFEIKGRPRFDPLIVHVSGSEQLPLLTDVVPPEAQLLIEQFWPGPLTLVLSKSLPVPDLVTAGLPTVAIRMPRHPLALELIRRTGVPIAAPSANSFGCTSPTTARHVLDQLAGKVDLVIDGGECPVGIESTIVSFACCQPVLLRPGGLAVEEIEALIGPLEKAPTGMAKAIVAPGMLPRHYATHTPMQLCGAAQAFLPSAGVRMGILAFQKLDDPSRFAAVEILSAEGDLREAAANLFGAMRRLDTQDLDMIVAETAPDRGLGIAINDRLARATGKRTKGMNSSTGWSK